MHPLRRLHRRAIHTLRHRRRHKMLRHTRRILRLIIIKRRPRPQLRHRQRTTIQNRNRQLTPGNKHLHKQIIIITTLHRRHISPAADNANSNAGTPRDRLHHKRTRKRLKTRPHLRASRNLAGRHTQTNAHRELARLHLVHRQRRRPRRRMCEQHIFKPPRQIAVLAVTAMQRVKHKP